MLLSHESGSERWKAGLFAVAVVALSFVNTIFLVRISYAQRNFSTAMSGKDVVGFYSAVWEFVVIICIAAPLFSFTSFLEVSTKPKTALTPARPLWVYGPTHLSVQLPRRTGPPRALLADLPHTYNARGLFPRQVIQA